MGWLDCTMDLLASKKGSLVNIREMLVSTSAKLENSQDSMGCTREKPDLERQVSTVDSREKSQSFLDSEV